MKEEKENQYVKRTQKDYSYAFKLRVVEEIENGEIVLLNTTFIRGAI